MAWRMKRPLLWWYLGAGVALVAAIAATVSYLGSFPPRVVVMTTGSAGSAYEAFGQSYREILARSGVELRLMPSAGGVENLNRLNDPRSRVTVGFVQGGLTSEKKSPTLMSLVTLFYEPIWLFYRGPSPGMRLEGLRGRRVSIGREGSGTRAVVLQFLALNGLDQSIWQQLPMTEVEASDSLLRGEIDAAVIMTSWESASVRRLLADPDVNLGSFLRADAYVALYPFLTKLVLPTGAGNMTAIRPPQDTNLLAPKASLVVRKDLHTALQYLLLNAASEIHSGPGIFQKSGQFPAAERVDLPLSEDAQQFYKSGRPFLQRYLPFWLAALAGHLLVLLIPVIAIAYPLLRTAPAAYAWHMRRRIFRFYGEVKLIEIELERGPAGHDPEDLRGTTAPSRGTCQSLTHTHSLHAYALYAARPHRARQGAAEGCVTRDSLKKSADHPADDAVLAQGPKKGRR